MAVVDELVTLLGLKNDPKNAKEAGTFEKMIAGITSGAIAAGAALVGIASATAVYAAKVAESVDGQAKFADSIGIGFDKLQELEFGMSRTGGNANELRGDLKKLTESMSSPIPGEYNQTLYMMGISARTSSGQLRKADEVLLDIADRLKGMSAQKQVQFAAKLGLSEGTLRLVQQGRIGIEKFAKQARDMNLVLDEAAKEKAAKFRTSILNVRSTLEGISKSIAIGLLPVLSSSIDKFSEWIDKNSVFISNGIGQVLEGVGRGFEMVSNWIGKASQYVTELLGPFGDLATQLDYTQPIALLVAGAITAIAISLIAAYLPVLLMIAGLAALILVIDDIYAAFNGGGSVIGDWVKSFAKAYPQITAFLGFIWDILFGIGKLLAGSLIESVKLWGGVFIDVLSFIFDMIGSIVGLIENIFSGKNPFMVLYDYAVEVFALIFGLFDKVGGRLGNFFEGMFKVTQEIDAKVLPNKNNQSAGKVPAPAGTVANNASSNSTTTININGAGNPAAVANEVMRQSGQSLQQIKPGMLGPVIS